MHNDAAVDAGLRQDVIRRIGPTHLRKARDQNECYECLFHGCAY